MIKIDYPIYQPKLKTTLGKEYIFDPFRKRWIVLTPEEWVRQNFLQYLKVVLDYPSSLIAVEKQLSLGDVKKRFDIVIYDKNAKPFMIIECKEMNVALTEKVLHQVLRYNTNIQANYLLITNGSHCIGFEKKMKQFQEIKNIPAFK